MMTFCLSGLLWVVGYAVFIPGMLTYLVLEEVDHAEAFWMMLVGDVKGQYLTFENFMSFNFRRSIVLMLTCMISAVFIMPIPGLSAILMPLMGLFAVWNLLDFQNIQQIWWTLGLPFMRPEQYDYNLLMQYQY